MTTTTTPITALVHSGESVFTAITGKSTDNQQKIVDGATNLLDGALPTIESRVSFNLASVLTGATSILGGIALIITGLKAKKNAETTANSEAPSTAQSEQASS